jgi:serine/threonine protein kinase
MYSISLGVLALHNNGILHRDLKAANILVVPNKDWMKSEEEGLVTAFEWCNLSIKVGDYERSEDAMGTGFWRPPEVLPGSADKRGWTREGDVYSFAMVCYEILTGRFPFEGELLSVYEPVLSGQRPELPAYVSKDMKKLLERCWDADQDKRPNFSVISSGIMYIFANEYGLELDKYRQECIRKYEDLQLQVHLDKISNAKSQLQRFQADMDILLKLSHMVRNF